MLLACRLAILKHWMVAESAAGDHLFIGKPAASTGKKFHKAVLKEWDLLKGSLPSSIWMQAYESRHVHKPLLDASSALFHASPGPHKESLTVEQSNGVSSYQMCARLGSLFLACPAYSRR